MKYLSKYKLFESESKEETLGSLKSKIFRFYSPIPNNRYRASSVIKKILNNEGFDILKDKEIKLDNIGYNETSKLKNKLRFEEYLNALLGEMYIDSESGDKVYIKDTDTRGFNFEGLIAGLFNGFFNTDKKGTWDVKLNVGGKSSIKFKETETENTSLTSIASLYKSELLSNLYGFDILKKEGIKEVLNKIKDGVKNVNDNGVELDNTKLKSSIKKILEITFKDVDIFITGSKKENNLIIQVYKKEDIISGILKEGLYASRGPIHQIRTNLSKFVPINTININLPKTTDEEIIKIYNGKNRDWADVIFKDWSNRIRTDFIDYFYDNREMICRSIKAYDEYLSKKDFND